MDKHENEVDLLKKEIQRLKDEAKESDEMKKLAADLYESMSKQRGMSKE